MYGYQRCSSLVASLTCESLRFMSSIHATKNWYFGAGDVAQYNPSTFGKRFKVRLILGYLVIGLHAQKQKVLENSLQDQGNILLCGSLFFLLVAQSCNPSRGRSSAHSRPTWTKELIKSVSFLLRGYGNLASKLASCHTFYTLIFFLGGRGRWISEVNFTYFFGSLKIGSLQVGSSCHAENTANLRLFPKCVKD